MGDVTNEPSSHTDLAKKIAQTLVFFDVESTGLPFSIGKRNVQITELCLVAVDRTEFENSENVRILNKLCLTIKPRSNVSLEAIHMTGLCNTSLQFQEHFSPITAQILQLFCQRLNQPICLLAHNGRRFDFPVLQAELKNIGAKLSDSVYCADTIDAFRQILTRDSFEAEIAVNNSAAASSVCHHGSRQHLTPEKDNSPTDKSFVQYYDVDILTSNNIDELLCQEMEIFENLIPFDELLCEMEIFENLTPEDEPVDSFPLVTSTNSDGNNIVNDILSTDDLFGPCSSPYSAKTPLNKTASIPARQAKCMVSAAEQITPDKKGKSHSSARRKLFNSKDIAGNSQSPKKRTSENKTKMSFSLKNLYHHFFKCDIPLAHFAEGDCMALMRISRKAKGFLPWVDEHMILFDKVKPLW